MKIIRNILLIFLLISLCINVLVVITHINVERNYNLREVYKSSFLNGEYELLIYTEDNGETKPSDITMKESINYDNSQNIHINLLHNNEIINNFSFSLNTNNKPVNTENFEVSFDGHYINIKTIEKTWRNTDYYTYYKIPINIQDSVKDVLELTELNNFQNYLNDIKNNGFINHTYISTNDIKLSEVLYNNTSIGRYIDKESEEYLYISQQVSNDNLLSGDILSFKLNDIQDFYYQRTLTNLSQEVVSATLNYCEKYDIYWNSYNDTHYTKVTCLSGYIDDSNLYHIQYTNSASDKKYEVILGKNNNIYTFITNQILE